jgi:diacylglycerol kinase
MKIHAVLALIALALALVLRLSTVELLFVMLSIAVVIIAELLNTAIEKTVDLAMPDWHPTAKIAKDVAAAAVFVAAVFAFAVGVVVFGKPLYKLIQIVWATLL